MPEHLFIAEKPTVAATIAKARARQIGVTASQGEGAWRVGDDMVTWLFGHMYELAKPEEYEPRFKRWEMGDLPIIPSAWRRNPHTDKARQLSNIKGFLAKSKIVVNVGDAGREGQLLVDELLEEMGWNPFSDRTKRVWLKSMTDRDVGIAMEAMFPNVDKHNLFKAAVMRQRADWLHGLNLTRLYTILARRSGADMLVSVGRVQSPTLKLVVDRDREIADFKPVDHYLPTGLFVHANGKFRADWVIPEDHPGLDPEGRLIDRAAAEEVMRRIVGRGGRIDSVASVNKSKAPPLLYSLSALQKDCSAKLGLTASQTLEIAQSLYERHKVTTYPRSDSQYLPKSILSDEAPGIVDALAKVEGLSETASNANVRIRSSAWNDSKVTDHHAIIPTGECSAAKLAALSTVERQVFDLIAKAFLAQFYPDFTWKSLSAIVKVGEDVFRATGRQVTGVGWRTVYGAGADDEEDEKEKEADQALPSMAKGDPVAVEKSDVLSKRTQPPPYFTDGTLIDAMKNIHKFVKEPEIKKRLRENEGIGTEATRSTIIDTLLHPTRRFLERKGKTRIVSTRAGQDIIQVLPKEVVDPGLTAVWETQLAKIASGEASEDNFMEVLERTLRRIVEHGRVAPPLQIRGRSLEPLPGHGETCPKCGQGTMLTRKVHEGEQKDVRYLACSNWRKDDPTSCRHSVWPERPRSKIQAMAGEGRSCPKCGKGTLTTRVSKKGTRFLSCTNWRRDDPTSCDYVEWDEPRVEPMPGDGTPCAKCGKGTMRTRTSKEGKRFLSCDNWRRDDESSCRNVVWDDSAKGPDSRHGAKAGTDSKGAGRSSSASAARTRSAARPRPRSR